MIYYDMDFILCKIFTDYDDLIWVWVSTLGAKLIKKSSALIYLKPRFDLAVNLAYLASIVDQSICSIAIKIKFYWWICVLDRHNKLPSCHRHRIWLS